MNRSKILLKAALACALTLPVQADLITNGGFESGLTGWTRVDQVGSDGTFFVQSGTTSPVLGNPVPAPPQGSRAAMTDAEAGGSHVLYQDFVVPTGLTTVFLTFDLFIHNWANEFVSPTPWISPRFVTNNSVLTSFAHRPTRSP